MRYYLKFLQVLIISTAILNQAMASRPPIFTPTPIDYVNTFILRRACDKAMQELLNGTTDESLIYAVNELAVLLSKYNNTNLDVKDKSNWKDPFKNIATLILLKNGVSEIEIRRSIDNIITDNIRISIKNFIIFFNSREEIKYRLDPELIKNLDEDLKTFLNNSMASFKTFNNGTLSKDLEIEIDKIVNQTIGRYLQKLIAINKANTPGPIMTTFYFTVIVIAILFILDMMINILILNETPISIRLSKVIEFF